MGGALFVGDVFSGSNVIWKFKEFKSLGMEGISLEHLPGRE